MDSAHEAALFGLPDYWYGQEEWPDAERQSVAGGWTRTDTTLVTLGPLCWLPLLQPYLPSCWHYVPHAGAGVLRGTQQWQFQHGACGGGWSCCHVLRSRSGAASVCSGSELELLLQHAPVWSQNCNCVPWSGARAAATAQCSSLELEMPPYPSLQSQSCYCQYSFLVP